MAYQERISLYQDEWAPVVSQLFNTVRWVGYMASDRERREMSDSLRVLSAINQIGPDSQPETIEMVLQELSEWGEGETNSAVRSLIDIETIKLSESLKISQARTTALQSMEGTFSEWWDIARGEDKTKITPSFPKVIYDLMGSTIDMYKVAGEPALRIGNMYQSAVKAMMPTEKRMIKEGEEWYWADTMQEVLPDVEPAEGTSLVREKIKFFTDIIDDPWTYLPDATDEERDEIVKKAILRRASLLNVQDLLPTAPNLLPTAPIDTTGMAEDELRKFMEELSRRITNSQGR